MDPSEPLSLSGSDLGASGAGSSPLGWAGPPGDQGRAVMGVSALLGSSDTALDLSRSPGAVLVMFFSALLE